VQRFTNAENGLTSTVMACCCAIGNIVPPFVIFRSKRKDAEFCDEMPPGIAVEMSETGCMISRFSPSGYSIFT
jgi:hypothetical protein